MRLLVSVTCARDALRALEGGAAIVDVKDPREGALGAPSPAVLAEVVAAVAGRAPVSVALGDLPALPHTAALAAIGAARCGAAIVKAGLRDGDYAAAVATMRAIRDAVGPGVAVIAAAYADADTLDPPALQPSALPAIVAAAGIDGALVDTFDKRGAGLLDLIEAGELRTLRDELHAVGATFGVAGRLSLDDLGCVEADLAGMRGALCRGGDRLGEIDPALVAEASSRLARAATV